MINIFLDQFSVLTLLKIFLYLVLLTLLPTLSLGALWLDLISSVKAKNSASTGFLPIELWYALLC